MVQFQMQIKKKLNNFNKKSEKILEDELTPINEQQIEAMDESDLIAEMNTPSVVDKIKYNPYLYYSKA